MLESDEGYWGERMEQGKCTNGAGEGRREGTSQLQGSHVFGALGQLAEKVPSITFLVALPLMINSLFKLLSG